jgi:dihydrofolate synthase / folylpolyglutamate synthase
MNILGNSLNEIAFEKAGIIKHNVPVIISQRQDEVEDIFINKAFEMNSGLTFASDEWDIFRSQTQNNSSGFLNLEIRQKTNIETPFFSFDSIELDLTGSYQLKNLAGVLSAVKHLRLMGYQIDDQDVLFALRQVKKLTGLMGRWHILKYDPLIICDTGHNEDGIREVMKNINLTPHKDLHMVIGMVKDKDISKILSLLPQKAFYYFCEPTIPRAKPAKHLQLEAAKFGLNGAFYPTVQAAFHEAKKNAGNNDLIFIGGSTFVVAEII